MVIIAGGELATGNIGVIFPAFLSGKVSLVKMVKAWAIVYAGNFVGSILCACFLAYSTDIFGGSYVSPVIEMAESKTSKSFMLMFISGMGCNWLVNLAVYMSTASKSVTCKIISVWFPVMVHSYLFLVLNFARHS